MNIDSQLLPFYIALFTGAITVIGWVVTNYLLKKREDRIRRLEATKKYLERQIEEFYGPLFNLIHQIVVCNHVQHEILSRRDQLGNLVKSGDEADVIRQFFQDAHFLPLHKEMISILKTKLYLIEGTELPESFYQYLRSSIQEQAQGTLWRQHHIDTSYVRGIPYPNDLYKDVKDGLNSAMFEYELCINNLIAKNDGRPIGMSLEEQVEDNIEHAVHNKIKKFPRSDLK